MMIGLLPVPSYAVTRDYTYDIQCVVVNEDGNLIYGAQLESKNFRGTTNGGFTCPETTWQWTPMGNNYQISATIDSAVNASALLKYPTSLWNYDENEYEFIGIGRNSLDWTPDLTEDVGNSYLFEKIVIPYLLLLGCEHIFFSKKHQKLQIPPSLILTKSD
jgi:hypothetical protein